MSKRLVCWILSIILLLSPAYASQSDFTERESQIKSNTLAFLESVEKVEKLVNRVVLYNFDDEIEALYYGLSSGGYIITSYKDGRVIEFSPSKLPIDIIRLASGSKIYFNGPFSYYTKVSSGQFKHAVSGEVISKPAVGYCKAAFVENVGGITYEYQLASSGYTPLLYAPINYVSASNGWKCTITGVTNLLQWYNDYVYIDVYMSGAYSVSTLRSALSSNYYVANSPLYLSHAAYPYYDYSTGVSYHGLKYYCQRSDVTYRNIVVTTHSVSKVKTQISTYWRPVLLAIYTSSIDSSASATSTHTVMCYGFWETSMTTYYIVNNGWGSNGVYICSDYIPSTFEILYSTP